MTAVAPGHLQQPAAAPRFDAERVSTRFGVAFSACQVAVLVGMALFVLPHGGSPSDPPLVRGRNVHDAASAYQIGNYVFMISGTLLLGFLGAVHARLRRVDASGTLSTVATSAGVLLALIWPLAGMLHDVAIDTAGAGADLRILAGWDAVAPYALAFSVFARVFFTGSIVLGLRAAGGAPWLVRSGTVLIVLALAGSATLVAGALFPLLALSTVGYELWVGVLAWRWLRD
jgi:hypothetical protein